MSEQKISPFDFVNAIYARKNIVVDDWSEKQYSPYLVNKALSFGADTVIPANEMNCRPHIDKKAQNLFLINIIEPRKRYNKWFKSEKIEDVELVQQYYGYSIKKAHQVISLLTEDNIKIIKERLYKGGI